MDYQAHHEEFKNEGWSFLELIGGPSDGAFSYFRGGAPQWTIFMLDPSVDPEHYKPGDPEHCYAIAEGRQGHAVYEYRGPFRRHAAKDPEPA